MKNTKLILLVSLCLLTLGCSSTIKRAQNQIKHKNNLENIAQRYAYKYKSECRKEAYQYYPVDNQKVKKYGNVITFEPKNKMRCMKYGHIVECEETTNESSIYNPEITVDVNANERQQLIRSCVEEALKQDDDYINAVINEKNRHSNAQRLTTRKENNLYKRTYLRENTNSDSKPWDWNSKQNRKSKQQKRVTLQLSDSKKSEASLYCYYGEDKRPILIDLQECPKFHTFEL